MSLLSKKVIKTAVVLNEDIREKINHDLAEGNFIVISETCKGYPYQDYMGSIVSGLPDLTTEVVLHLHSGFTITIETN